MDVNITRKIRLSYLKKILIVDDDTDIVKYLSTLFMDNNFEVSTAFNGKECMEKAVSEHPDLITLDITMPVETGVRVLRNLKEKKETERIPVIIISGITNGIHKFLNGLKRAEPKIVYFDKPIDRNKLMTKINEILKNKYCKV